jgi:hypothetical protein
MDAFVFVVVLITACSLVFVRRALSVQGTKAATLTTIPGFNAVVKYDGVLGGRGIAMDPETSRFALSGVGVTPTVFDFAQLIAVDIERDGNTITTTRGSNGLATAALGAALLGPVGLLLGGGTRSTGTTIPTITKLAMKIYVNDLAHPCHEVVFYRNAKGASRNSGMVALAVKQMDDWYGRFRTVLAMKETGESRFDSPKLSTSVDTSASEEERPWTKRVFGA